MRAEHTDGRSSVQSAKAIYLYGVVDQREVPESFDWVNMPSPVRCLPVGELGALIKDVALPEFGEQALKERMKDPQWLQEQVWNHAQVLEAAMRFATVIPMKFLTLFNTEERLRENLLALDGQLREMFRNLQGREEWGVKVFCDLGVIQVAVGTQHDGVRQLKAQIAAKPSGTAYLLQKHSEEVIRQESTLRLTVHLDSISSRVSSVAEETQFNPPGQETSGHPMVMNVSLLVQKTGFSNLVKVVNALREEYQPRGFQFELVGPFPPYSFSKLPINAGEHEANRIGDAAHA